MPDSVRASISSAVRPALSSAHSCWRVSDVRYLRVNLVVMLAALGVLYFANSYIEILICVGVFAFALSCVFSIVYSLALRRRPGQGQ